MTTVSANLERLCRSVAVPFLFLLLSLPAAAADLVPRLVRDIDQTAYTASSSPRQAAGVNHGFAFTAFGNRELWFYDEREDSFSVSLKRREIRQLIEGIYAAREASGGWTLWAVDGFPYFHTTPVTDQPIARIGRVYTSTGSYFQTWLYEGDNGHGTGLWAVDGAHHRPVEVARPRPYPDGTLLRDMTIYHGTTYFIARHRDLGTALWTTDTTPAGTFPVIAPAPGTLAPVFFPGVVRNRMLLAVSGETPALWLSDGTARGTRKLVEIGRGRAGAGISDAVQVPFSKRVFFVADDGRTGKQLWVTNGTVAGTRRLTRFTAADPFAGSPLSATTLDGRLVFFADDGVHGRELWWTDGTPEGTRLLADACPGACGTAGTILTTLPAFEDAHQPERLLFSAQGPDGGGLELWSTDGTPGGAGLVSDLCPGPCSGDPQGFSAGYLIGAGTIGATFTAATPDGGRALWFTDGTAAQTRRLTPPGATVTSLSPLAVSDAEFGDEFWTTDGTPEGTHLWRDLGREIDEGSQPAFLGAAGDRAVFTASTPAGGLRLYASDGTAAGTQPLALPEPGPELSFIYAKTTAAGRAVFTAPVHGTTDHPALWATDGTAAGVERLTPPGIDVTSGPWPAGKRIVFFATDAEHGAEPWVSDGTPGSTHLLADLVPGAESSADGIGARTLHGQVLFGRYDDLKPWITDGTPEGTLRLIDAYPFLVPAENLGNPLFTEAAGKLYFAGSEEPNGQQEVWVSDWTAAGTHSLGFPSAGRVVDGIYPAGSRLFLFIGAADPDDPSVPPLWVINSGSDTAVEAPPINVDSQFGIPPTPFGDRLVLTDFEHRLLVTDGTAAGTFLLHDQSGQEITIYEGRAVSFAGHLVTSGTLAADLPYGFAPCYVWDGAGPTAVLLDGLFCDGDFSPAGSRLFFSGFEPHTGVEPWVFEER